MGQCVPTLTDGSVCTVGAKKTFPKLFIVHRSCSIRTANDMNDERCERRSSFTNDVRRSVRGARPTSFYMYTQYTWTCIIITRCTSTHVDYMYTFVHSTGPSIDSRSRTAFWLQDNQSAARICCLQNVRIVHERHFDYKINARMPPNSI